MTIEEVRNKLAEMAEEDIKTCSPYQRLGLLINIEEFFTPKKQRTSILGNENELPKDFHEAD